MRWHFVIIGMSVYALAGSVLKSPSESRVCYFVYTVWVSVWECVCLPGETDDISPDKRLCLQSHYFPCLVVCNTHACIKPEHGHKRAHRVSLSCFPISCGSVALEGVE